MLLEIEGCSLGGGRIVLRRGRRQHGVLGPSQTAEDRGADRRQ